MKCSECGNPLNEWQDDCDICKKEVVEKCRCHGKSVRRVKGSYAGDHDAICSVTGMLCLVRYNG